VRNFINIINEAMKPTKTGDKTGLDFDLMPHLDKGAVATTGAGRDVRSLPGKKTRRRKSVNVAADVGAEAGRHFGSLSQHDMPDEIDDEEARRRAGLDDPNMDDTIGAEPVPPTTENLPAVIRTEVEKTGGKIFPEWRQIKHLPGYIQQPIRALGRAVFGQFTDTPIEDIQMIGTIGGLNPDRDVAGMMKWIERHGVRDDAANIDFSQIMPGYRADVSLWRTEDYSFLLVSDFGGKYIYAWAGGRGFRMGDEPANRKRLR
jgi:hypothetical protein